MNLQEQFLFGFRYEVQTLQRLSDDTFVFYVSFTHTSSKSQEGP